MNNIIKPIIGMLDDHAVVRKGIRALLEALKIYDIVFDVENFEGLKKELKANKKIDILLLDIKMPDISGFDVAAWMRDHYPLIKVLAVSSEHDGFSIAKIMRNGAKGFVSKDADEIELSFAIQQVLKGDAYLSQKSFNMFNDVLQNSSNYFNSDQKIDFNDKEIEFIKWSCTALNYKEIGERMCLSQRTVEGYRTDIFNKIGIHTRQELAVYAVLNKLN